MQSRAGNGSGQWAAEDGGTTWQRPALPAPSLARPAMALSPARWSMSALEREEGGHATLGCGGDGGWRRARGRQRVRRGEEGGRDIEEGRREHQFSGQCGHPGCCGEKKLCNEARGREMCSLFIF
jgi:hypothetical protein